MTAACPACVAVPMPDNVLVAPDLQFSLPSIHCAACIGKIERGLQDLPGLRSARVNLSLKRLTVTGTVAAEVVAAALHQLGYAAYPLDLAALNTARDTQGRALLLRMAVAGFAMMNVMLLSVAVWSGATDATRDLFHLISAMIALPVVAYSGQPFFQNAWQALRVRRLNMDVPISLAILLAAGMSLYETLNSGAHAYFDAALSLTFFLLIGRYMDHRTRLAARSAAKELTALEVQTAQKLVAGGTKTTPVSDLCIGDHLLVPTGARIPVDGMLLTDSALIDRAFLTGESAAVTCGPHSTLQAGEINLGAPITLQATAVGEDTTLRRMAQMVAVAENGRNSYTAMADRAAQVYAPAVHLLAFAAFIGWVVVDGDVRHALNVAIAVLIITCPCALGLAVPAVSTAAIGRLFSMGYLVKHATALERLAEVDRIVFDKTGTLSRPSVRLPDDLTDEAARVAKALAQASHHPLSRALDATLDKITPADVKDVCEVSGQGLFGNWRGQRVKLGRGTWLGGMTDGLCLQIGDAPVITFTATEEPRAGISDALEGLDLPCEIVTGDATAPATDFAARLGLAVKPDMRPEQKLSYLRSLATTGDRVLMVGDGLNDTAALAAAHASVAPASALDAARSASDVVVLTDSFAKLPLLIRIARLARHLSQQNFAIATIYNCIAVPVALAGYATPLAAALAMSASSITVLLNAQRIRFAT